MSNNERMTPGQPFRIGEIVAEAVHGAGLTKEQAQLAIGKPQELGDCVVNFIKGLSTTQTTVSPAIQPIITDPADLMTILEIQANRLIEVGAHDEAKISKGKYLDELMTIAKAFLWRSELATIGLTEVALIDYRLRGQFLAEAGGVNCYITPDKCRNFEGIITPSGIMVIQAQWGGKYRNKKPLWCRQNFHILEQGGVVKEGLTAFLYGGKELLKECYMDFPGSVSGSGNVPYLRLYDGQPGLDDDFDNDAVPSYGSFSRGK